MVWDLWDRRRGGWRPFVGPTMWTFSVPLLIAAVNVIWLEMHGQLNGLLTFYMGLDDIAAYGAWPTDVALESRQAGSEAFLMLVAAALLVGTGIYERLRSTANTTEFGDALLGLGCVVAMVMQKDAIRPNESQFFFLAVVGLAIAVSSRRRQGLADYIVIGCPDRVFRRRVF